MEMVDEALFGRFIVFTPVIIIFATDFRPVLINPAGAIFPNMLAFAGNKQEPAAIILIYLNIGMRDLP